MAAQSTAGQKHRVLGDLLASIKTCAELCSRDKCLEQVDERHCTGKSAQQRYWLHYSSVMSQWEVSAGLVTRE